MISSMTLRVAALISCLHAKGISEEVAVMKFVVSEMISRAGALEIRMRQYISVCLGLFSWCCNGLSYFKTASLNKILLFLAFAFIQCQQDAFSY